MEDQGEHWPQNRFVSIEPESSDPQPPTCMICYALVSPGYEPEHSEWHSDLRERM
jgi:hypothetical protein